MRAILLILITWAMTACKTGDLSDRPQDTPITPTIVSSEFQAEIAEPNQPPAGRRDGTLIFVSESSGYKIPRHRAILWGGIRNTSAGPTYIPGGAMYNPRQNKWLGFAGENQPLPRSGHSLLWSGSNLIMWGGDSGFSKLSSGFSFNFESNKWTALSPPPDTTPRSGHQALMLGQKMFILGGTAGGSFAMAYKIDSDSWDRLPQPTPRPPDLGDGFILKRTSGELGVGYVSGGYLALFFQSDNDWTTMAVGDPKSKNRAIGASDGEKAYLLNAATGSDEFTLYTIDSDKISLQKTATLPIQAFASTPTMFVSSTHIMLFGADPAGKNRVYTCAKTDCLWKSDEESPASKPGQMAALMDDGKLFLWGGESPIAEGERYDIGSYIFDLATNRWSYSHP